VLLVLLCGPKAYVLNNEENRSIDIANGTDDSEIIIDCQMFLSIHSPSVRVTTLTLQCVKRYSVLTLPSVRLTTLVSMNKW